MVFIHRYHSTEGVKGDRHILSIAALFLAGKAEETPMRLEGVIGAWSECSGWLGDRSVMAEYSKQIRIAERRLLLAMCFDLSVDHPYRHLDGLFKHLGNDPDLIYTSKALLIESLFCPFCLVYPAPQIAAAVVRTCLRALGLAGQDEKTMLDESVVEIANRLEDLYPLEVVARMARKRPDAIK